MKKNNKLTIQGVTNIIGQNIAVVKGVTWFIRTVHHYDDFYDFICCDAHREIRIRLLRNSPDGSLCGWNWVRPDNTISYITKGYISNMQNAIHALETELKHILN